MNIVEHVSLLHAGESSGYIPGSGIAGSSGSEVPSFRRNRQIDFQNCFFLLCEELSWDFDGDCVESVDCFGKMAILTILILPIHEHGRFFHFLRSSSISFFKDLKFLSYFFLDLLILCV